jgi:hypothetical protein
MMMRRFLPLLPLAALALNGCVAGMAASAAGMAIRSAQGQPVSNVQAHPAAVEACTSRAAPFGTVHVIDVEQRSPSRIIVWGSVDDGKQKQSFECGYGTKINGFKLRAITLAR